MTYKVALTAAATVSNTGSVKSDEVTTAVNGSDTVDITQRSTSTSLICGPSPAQIGSPIICTAVVTDTDAGTQLDPTGTVAFTTDGTGSFTAATGYSFTAPNTCTLVSDGNPATFTSKCSVTYTTAVANVDNIGAAYSGSTIHLPSSASTVMAVFYDPGAGFVTGGGYINHLASGMIPAGSTMASKANYGFVAKYKKGATTPDGETEFQLKPANLNFHTSSLDWLVINTAGTRAQYQGTGTINGAGTYGFLVTVIDGGSTDYFRIRIWEKANPANIIYDNEPGRPDSSDPGTIATGGNIVIHK